MKLKIKMEWWRTDQSEINDEANEEDDEFLQKQGIERIHESLNQGYTSGELNAIVTEKVNGQTIEREYIGWWSIEEEND